MPKPKVIYAWNLPWNDPGALMFMGVQKNPDGTGYKRLEAGDVPRRCTYCGKLVSDYPHAHTKADWETRNDRQA